MALEWLDAIEARANAATQGPWVYEPECYGVMVEGADVTICSNALPVDEEFIAHARSDVPKLCRAVRELYEMLAEALPYLETHATPGADYLATEARKVLERWDRGGD